MNEPIPGRKAVLYRPIGVIRSDHRDPVATPIQPVFARGHRGRVEILPEYEDGLRDIEGFSHLYLIYHFHRAGPVRLTLNPLVGKSEHGLFAMRVPDRPNPIGLSIVELLRREGRVLHVDGLDILDQTPLLDIKPYTARFDHVQSVRNGWQETAEWTSPRVTGETGKAET